MCHELDPIVGFQIYQYPNMRPDEIELSFRDPAAMEALHAFAELTEDDDLAMAIVRRLDSIAEEYVQLHCTRQKILTH